MATVQTIISGSSDDPATTGTQYSLLMGQGGQLWAGTESLVESIIPTAGTLTNFKVGVKTAPSAGKSWTFTIRKAASGAAMADTTLSVTISDTAVLSALDSDSVTVAAGDRVTISATGTETPTAAAAVYLTCQFIPDTAGETVLLGFATLVTNYYSTIIGGKGADATEFDAQTLFPTAGTLKNFYVELVTAPGADTSRIFTIRLNGVDQSLVVTISDAAVTGNMTTNPITIAAGDKVTILQTVTGTPAASTRVKFGIIFLPDTSGEWFTSATTDDPTSSTAVEFQQLTAGDTTLVNSTNEAEQHGLAQATTAKAIYVNLSTAPGNGNSWIFTLREALADTALTVTISGTATSGNAAVDEAVAADALVNLSIDARPGSATSASQIAVLFYNAPTGGDVTITLTATMDSTGANTSPAFLLQADVASAMTSTGTSISPIGMVQADLDSMMASIGAFASPIGMISADVPSVMTSIGAFNTPLSLIEAVMQAVFASTSAGTLPVIIIQADVASVMASIGAFGLPALEIVEYSGIVKLRDGFRVVQRNLTRF